MKQILIMGGGFLGRYIAKRLHHYGGYRITVINKINSVKYFDDIEYISCDLSNLAEVYSSLRDRRFDCIINSMGYIDHGNNPIEHLKNGGFDKLVGLINILKISSPKKIINFATNLERLEGSDGYQLCNRTISAIIKNIAESGEIKIVSIVIPHIIGPGQKGKRLIPYIFECIKKNCNIELKEDITKNYLHIEDFSELVQFAIEDESSPEIIYAEGSINKKASEIIEVFEELMGRKIEYSSKRVNYEHPLFPTKNYSAWAPKIELKSAILDILKDNSEGNINPNKNNQIRLSKSTIGLEEKIELTRVMNFGYLGMGSKVLEFEEAISSLIGAKACCVVNGTAALHLALLSCGVGEGDEVLVPSFTYVATYQAISAVGATPVHCEINPKTGTIDINDLREKITSKTKVIMPVHFIGSCDQIETIYEIAKELKLRVIEDAAHSFGGSDSRGRIGANGDITCFSFDGIKNITCGEGGAVVSNNEQVIKFISQARLLGVENDSLYRYQNSRITKKIEVNSQGWRYHMSNIMAAIGIAQIKKIGDISRYRRKLAERYIQLLSNHERIQILEKDYLKIIPHTFGILLEGVSKEKLIDAAAKNFIELGYGYYPNHKLNYYSDGSLLPITERFYENLITLPMHLDLTADDQKRVCEFLFNFLAECK